MKHFSRSVALTGLAASLVASLGAVSPQAAVAECTPQAAGTYLTTITSGPTATPRSTILLNVEGTMSVVDSGQGTVGFTAAQGTWDCQVQHGQPELQATALDFNTAGDMIFRTDYQATFDPQSETVAGTITLQTFPLAADPLGSGGTEVGTFAFTGQRIPAGGN